MVSQDKVPKAIWKKEDTTKLLDELFLKRSAIGQGGNFKQSVFNEVAPAVEAIRTKGAPKDGQKCKTHWKSLCARFNAIGAIQRKSGWTWSDIHGANITPSMAASWNDFLLKHPKAKDFRNAGWAFREKMASITPAKVTGENVLYPSQIASVPQTQASSQETPVPIPSTPEPSSTATPPPPHSEQRESSPEEDDELPQTLKRRASARTTTTQPEKRPRTTAASAFMQKTNQEMGRMNDIFEAMLNPAAAQGSSAIGPTPSRRREAITRAQDVEMTWLKDSSVVALIRVFQSDVEAVDTYMALKLEPVRKLWVRETLLAAGIDEADISDSESQYN
ncbi:hypothetical protein DFP72DRAFT_1126764 [Ephemerocybe angulata]|uniref:Myb/SANT-like domain-containing protein n=1 Tax=Ephemerocybe angulata TaxID=980116 RepID=A0A8H6HX42_9AGAR|nr:hypothetical protein DFP72DRAFT_1126764 [Tulosesus angulatus]